MTLLLSKNGMVHQKNAHRSTYKNKPQLKIGESQFWIQTKVCNNLGSTWLQGGKPLLENYNMHIIFGKTSNFQSRWKFQPIVASNFSWNSNTNLNGSGSKESNYPRTTCCIAIYVWYISCLDQYNFFLFRHGLQKGEVGQQLLGAAIKRTLGINPITWINKNIKTNGHPEYRMVENYHQTEMHDVQESIQRKVCGFSRSQDIVSCAMQTRLVFKHSVSKWSMVLQQLFNAND